MASGNAKIAFAYDPARRVLITDARRNPRWSELWEGLPWIAHPIRDRDADVQRLQDGPRCRPYIDYVAGFTRATGMNYTKGWRARDHMGFIQLNDAEARFAADMARMLGRFVVIEPHVKDAANQNKQWGWAKWQSLADLLAHNNIQVVQIGPAGTKRLQGVTLAVTPTFRYGAALMKHSRWNFLPDGGLHHACAVLGLPATVLWGGANDPEVLGYPNHVNIASGPACLKWTPCRHCAAIWQKLTAEEVFARTKEDTLWRRLPK